MCDLTAIGIGMSVVQAGASFIGQSQQAAATEKYNSQLAINATNAYDSSTTQGQTQQVFQDIKAAHAINEEDRTARGNEATAVNAAGEDGVGGNTMMELSRDYFNRASRAEGDIVAQRDASKGQIEQQIIGSGFQLQDRLNERRVVNEPSVFGALATAAGGAFKSVASIKPAWAQALFGPSTGPSGDNGADDTGGL